jgi:hypothetical protein
MRAEAKRNAQGKGDGLLGCRLSAPGYPQGDPLGSARLGPAMAMLRCNTIYRARTKVRSAVNFLRPGRSGADNACSKALIRGTKVEMDLFETELVPPRSSNPEARNVEAKEHIGKSMSENLSPFSVATSWSLALIDYIYTPRTSYPLQAKNTLYDRI